MRRLSLILSATTVALLLFSFAKKQGVEVGDKAPKFELKNVDGKMVSLDDFQDKEGVIVIFTCNHCPYAKAYEERIKALDAEYADKGWPVVAINPNDPEIVPEDSYEKMVEIAEEHNYSFPYLFDDKQKVFPKYGATRTPHAYLLKNEGKKFTIAYIGAIDDNVKSADDVKERFIEQAIAEIKAGKKVSMTETKAVGCSIKVK